MKIQFLFLWAAAAVAAPLCSPSLLVDASIRAKWPKRSTRAYQLGGSW